MSTGVISWDDAKRLGYGVDFVQPSEELPPSRPATKEGERNVQHSVGTLADPAANISPLGRKIKSRQWLR